MEMENDLHHLITVWEMAISKYRDDSTGTTHASIARDAVGYGSYAVNKSNDGLLNSIHANFGLLETMPEDKTLWDEQISLISEAKKKYEHHG